jgi:hypothetical protein
MIVFVHVHQQNIAVAVLESSAARPLARVLLTRRRIAASYRTSLGFLRF